MRTASAARPARDAENHRGALLLLASTAALAGNDACIKAFGASQPVFHAIFWRGLIVTGALVAIGWWGSTWRRLPRGRDARLLLCVAVAEVVTVFAYVHALLRLPLAHVIAIQQTLPVVHGVVAIAFLREPAATRRLGGVVLAFGGVLCIARPASVGFDPATLVAGLSVLSMAARDLLTRRLSPDVPSFLPALSVGAAVTLAAGLASIAEPRFTPTPVHLALLTGSAVFILAGSMLGLAAVRVGELGYVAPFRFTALPFALVIGFVLFDERPSALALVGCALIAAGGFLSLRPNLRTAKPSSD